MICLDYMNQLTVSLWGDEAFASILAQKNLFEIVTTAARDTSPPLHYILLHFWMQLFGNSEIAIRGFPILLFLLLSFVVYKFAEDVFNKRVARFALILTLLNPFLFLYAFEARMYMLLALTSTASMWFFMTKRWLLYVLATVAALYTHHFSIFIVFVQVIYYLSTNLKLSLKYHFKSPFIRSLLIIIILYLPWLPALYGQTTQVATDFWLPRPKIEDLWLLYSHFIAGSSKIPIESIILVTGLLLLALRGFKKHPDGLLYLWLFLPAILTYFLSQIGRPLFFDRYLIVSASALPILLASQRMSNAPGKRIALPLLILMIMGLFFINIHSFQNPVKQPFRELAQFIETTYGQDKIVVNYYTDALHYFELKHYDVNVKIYSPNGPLPFWVGTALVDKNDVLEEVPKEPTLLVMASGDIKKIQIPGYQELRRRQFRDLYLLWLVKSL